LSKFGGVALFHVIKNKGKRRTIQQVAEAAMVSKGTVSNVKRRYFEGGLADALYEKPRPGAKRKVDGEVEARLITLACSDPRRGVAAGCFVCWLTN
jgi:transposase